MDWMGIAATIAALGVIINNVLTFLARRDIAANTKDTKEAKAATQATGEKLVDATAQAKDAADIAERAGAIAEKATKGLAASVAQIQKQLNGELADKLTKIVEHDGRLTTLERRLARIEPDIAEMKAGVIQVLNQLGTLRKEQP